MIYEMATNQSTDLEELTWEEIVKMAAKAGFHLEKTGASEAAKANPQNTLPSSFGAMLTDPCNVVRSIDELTPAIQKLEDSDAPYRVGGLVQNEQ